MEEKLEFKVIPSSYFRVGVIYEPRSEVNLRIFSNGFPIKFKDPKKLLLFLGHAYLSKEIPNIDAVHFLDNKDGDWFPMFIHEDIRCFWGPNEKWASTFFKKVESL